ncbi:MAG: hypothetical protein LBT10_04960 [Methanobrevibacter sp.]|jgi:hypothetical protein|nr:hypothetical protein [Methanobrevibacter sp.]
MNFKFFKIKNYRINKIDSSGIAAVEFIFFIFTTLLIAILIMGLFQSQINSLYSLDENIQGRIILENISNQFNQISQSLESVSIEIYLPDKIANYKYSITVDYRNLILEFNNKKTRETIFPINLFNKNGDKISDIKLYSGSRYIISSLSTKNGVMVMSVNVY